MPRGKNVNGDDCYQDGGGDIDGDYGNVTMVVVVIMEMMVVH